MDGNPLNLIITIRLPELYITLPPVSQYPHYLICQKLIYFFHETLKIMEILSDQKNKPILIQRKS
ncbi:hypothetical protein C5467_13650 [Photorhabdus khanii subsp. guanajuatensis]|uniref:Uncharacterized protein n=1 Tax=Photorhabdus khanii subsp. guanajuatensis TaxID=2100166 RepID=A0A4R4JNP1_9GAMM|nr:hypothetical protein C5467_13650 [Photorhabdus khanii subsp. guanajuatensis]